MSYYKNTTQVSNILFDDLLKVIHSSQLKVLLLIIRKTTEQMHPSIPNARLDMAWISQKLFSMCCNISGRAVSSAVDALVKAGYIEVTDKAGTILDTKEKRRGTSRLYYASRLRLDRNSNKASEVAGTNPVNKGHTIKLNNSKLSCYNGSQGNKRLTDRERYLQILRQQNTQ